jgi:hypothetical protein
MQSAILDAKSSPSAYPRDEIAAQARCAERLNHVGFWQASHRLSEVRELRDACRFDNLDRQTNERYELTKPKDNASEIANPAELDLERSIESLLADDSDDVRDDTFEESLSDQCDIAKELKNQDEKQASIDSETSTKHDESNTKSNNLHEESIGLYTVTKSGNLQTKLTNRHNPLGSSASCNRDSAEISRLNSKLDRFSENVTNKLQNLSVEINNIKENKPYSILVL